MCVCEDGFGIKAPRDKASVTKVPAQLTHTSCTSHATLFIGPEKKEKKKKKKRKRKKRILECKCHVDVSSVVGVMLSGVILHSRTVPSIEAAASRCWCPACVFAHLSAVTACLDGDCNTTPPGPPPTFLLLAAGVVVVVVDGVVGGPLHPDTRRWPSFPSSLSTLESVITLAAAASSSSSLLSYCAIKSMKGEGGGRGGGTAASFFLFFLPQKSTPHENHLHKGNFLVSNEAANWTGAKK